MSIGPSWRGYLKLSLVSCPIALHVACSSSERVSFRQINRKTGNRLRQQLVDEVTREPVGVLAYVARDAALTVMENLELASAPPTPQQPR